MISKNYKPCVYNQEISFGKEKETKVHVSFANIFILSKNYKKKVFGAICHLLFVAERNILIFVNYQN